MEWRKLLSPDLVEAAYVANEEMAWDREHTIRVIDVLKSNGYLVLGIDVWLPTFPGPTIPTPFVYDWSLSFDAPPLGYPSTAAEFVRTFSWHASDHTHQAAEPYFNITASGIRG